MVRKMTCRCDTDSSCTTAESPIPQQEQRAEPPGFLQYIPSRAIEVDPILLDVPRTDPLYVKIAAECHGCNGSGLRVRRIQKIQNPGLAALYEAQKSIISQEVGGTAGLNEKSLYHGSSYENGETL